MEKDNVIKLEDFDDELNGYYKVVKTKPIIEGLTIIGNEVILKEVE